MKRNVLCALLLVLAFSISATLSSAQTPPEFKLGFKALADQIPDVVGAPLENEYFNLSTGNSEQHTTKGLMVWRKADNWTAFTNGNMTWINGQTGVQSRLNTERFLWENTPIGAEARRPAPIAAATQVPVPAAALVQGSGATAAVAQVPAATAAVAQVPAATAAVAQVPAATAAVAQAPAATAAVAQAPAATAAATTSTAGSSKDSCLACHGPFDKLVAADANYVWPNGDKQSPHRYVPHASTNAKDIPECTNCHKPHPVPPTASDIAAMAKPDPSWCFGCHHTGTLQCGTCHAIP